MARTRPWAIMTAVTFLATPVADDDDGGAFFGSGVVIVLVCGGLSTIGVWFDRRRYP